MRVRLHHQPLELLDLLLLPARTRLERERARTRCESELQRARALLWQHLDAAHGWKECRPETWTDDAYGGNRGLAGIMTSTRHSDCFWFVRTLPGVLDSFAAVYGTTDLVAAYDNMAINRPASCGQESVASLGNGRGGLAGWYSLPVSRRVRAFMRRYSRSEFALIRGL